MSRKDDLIAKWNKRRGLRARVNAMCISCVYDPKNRGTWRQQTGACTVTACPLHPVRPGILEPLPPTTDAEANEG